MRVRTAFIGCVDMSHRLLAAAAAHHPHDLGCEC